MTRSLKNVRRFAGLIMALAVLVGLAVLPHGSFSQGEPTSFDGARQSSLSERRSRLKSFSKAELPAFGSGLSMLGSAQANAAGGAFAVALTPMAAQAGVSYTWTGAVSTDWFTAGNWSPNGVPGAEDTATINISSATVELSQNTTIANFNFGNGALSGGGMLTVTGATAVSGGDPRFNANVTTSALNFSNGNLGGSATLTVTVALNWVRGAMNGPGTTVIPQGATATISGRLENGDRTGLEQGRTLNIAGTLILTGDDLTASNSVINNSGLIDIRGDKRLGIFGAINNTGTIRKSAGAGQGDIQGTLSNNGTVEVLSGTLTIGGNGGTSNGRFSVPSGTTLRFSVGGPTATLTNTASISGAGNVEFRAGNIVINGSYNVAGVTTISGNGNATFNTNTNIPTLVLTRHGFPSLRGSGTVTITGSLDWVRGEMFGPGTTVIPAGVTATVSGRREAGDFTRLSEGRTLNNSGTINLTGDNLEVGGVINNSSLIDIQSDHNLGVGGTINNTGTIRKSAGTGTADIQGRLNNNGAVQITSGALLLSEEGGTSSGSFSVPAGTTLRFNTFRSRATLTSAGSISGAGNVVFSAGTIINGSYNITGLTTITGGEHDFNVNVSIPNLDFTGGTLTGDGAVTITGVLNWGRADGDSLMGGAEGRGRTVIAAGAIANLTSGITRLSRTLDNFGTINYTSTGFGGFGPAWTLNNHGTFDIKADRDIVGGGTINNTGTFVKSGGTGLTNLTNFVRLNNSGTVEIKTGRVRQVHFEYIQTAGTTILSGGDLGAPTVRIKGGSLIGSGTVAGNVTNSGTISPGLKPGAAAILNISGTYTQTATGTLNIELGGPKPGAEFDQLIIGTGSVEQGTQFGGILNVILVNGFEPEMDASFQISRFNKREGTFGAINGLDLGGRSLDAVFSDFDLVLRNGSGAISEAQPWVDMVGPDVKAVRGQPVTFTYTITYGNSGGATVLVPIALILPPDAGNISVEGVVNPDGTAGPNDLALMPDDLTPEERDAYRNMPRVFRPEPGSNSDGVVIPMFMAVGPGERKSVPIGFTSECQPTPNSKTTPQVKMGDPVFVDNGATIQAVDCVAKIAGFALGLALENAPFKDCIKLGYSVLTKAIKGVATGEGVLGGFGGTQIVSTSASYFNLGVGALKCAGNFIPALKLAKTVSDVLKAITRGNDIAGIFDSCGRAMFPGLFGISRQKDTSCVASADPNDKHGTDGIGQRRFITGQEPLKYLITFENKPDATAPAQEVVITDQLDPATLDLNSFQLGFFSFGDRTVNAPPSASAFITDVDLRPGKNIILRINASLDKAMGIITWRFTSLDPITGQLPENPLVGFLPPNKNPPEGEGSVFFTIMPKKALPSGTEIRNRARIIFDANAPLDTGEWLNTIDNAKPASQVLALPAQSPPTFEVKWSGADGQSGIQNYTVFVSENGGPFTEWLTNTTAISASYAGQPNKSYGFYTVARDGTGLKEDAPAVADAVTNTGASAPPVLQFAASSFGVTEACTGVPVTVTRTGDLSAAATVNYSTSNGSASERSDYTVALGSLRFAPGEAAKTINVLITEDSIAEGNETLLISLSNPTAALMGGQSTATLEIIDDAIEPGVNTLDDPQAYVCQQYHDFLNRQPDDAGLQFWTNEITSCGADQSCVEVKRINVSAAFFLSIEFQETGYLVYRLHQAASGAGPLLKMRDFILDTQEIGRGVVVGAPGWEAQLEANKQAFVAAFVARPDFLSLYPAGMAAAEFIDKLNANAGASLSSAERDDLVGKLNAGTLTRAQALRAVAEDADFHRREFNRAFVYMQYAGYLRRNANETPDTNLDGYNFWLGKLNQFNGNFVQAEMVKAFITSIEYRSRFGQ